MMNVTKESVDVSKTSSDSTNLVQPRSLRLIVFEGMFHLAGHERIWVLLKDAQAGAYAEINPLFLIYGTGIIRWIFQLAATGGFEFRQRGCSYLSQGSVFLMMGVMKDIPGTECQHCHSNTEQAREND